MTDCIEYVICKIQNLFSEQKKITNNVMYIRNAKLMLLS